MDRPPARIRLSLLSLVAVAAAVAATVVPTGAGQAAPAGTADLRTAVTQTLLDRAAPAAARAGRPARADDARVTVTRRDAGRWAFGTAVLTAPRVEGAMPQGWLFLAQRQGSGWQVAFEGDRAFAALSARAPGSVVSSREKTLFTDDGTGIQQAGGDYRTGMRLPFAVGQSWYMRGGPHGWAGYDTPWSSIDLNGGDEVVRAPRGGTAYTMCQGWVRVVHDRGYSTDHYHLWSNIWVDGAGVSAGSFLGYTGTDVTCGGAASGRHVHFGLRQNGSYIGIAAHNLGKWVPYNGSAAYQGYALHGSTQVNAGGALYNYGALGFNQGVVDTNGGTSLNKRSGPGTNYPIVGSVADGATVTVDCSANGTSHTGRYGTTSLWNRLTDGTWVSDAFLWTGLDGPISGYC